MRMRKKPNLIPRLEACGELVVTDPKARKGHWRELMPAAGEVHLELGCGKGRFTVGTAQADPDVLLIAVERVPDAMVIAAERAKELGLKNVFFIDADAADAQGSGFGVEQAGVDDESQSHHDDDCYNDDDGVASELLVHAGLLCGLLGLLVNALAALRAAELLFFRCTHFVFILY